MTLHLVALGANSGVSFAANARRLTRACAELPGRVVRRSRIWRTPAWPPGAGPDFANAAVVLWCPMAPKALLEALHGIEARAGRVRRARWGARVLDLDLLASGALVRPDVALVRNWMDLAPAAQARIAPEGLVLPHPRMQDRAFVLLPLVEVAPDWRHPLTGRTVRAMARALPVAARRGCVPVRGKHGVVNGKTRA